MEHSRQSFGMTMPVDDSLPCVPYLATQQWYAEWLCRRLQGIDEAVARSAASVACGLRRRDFTRCTLPSAAGEIRLSVAVDGGSGMLKRLPPEAVQMSGHGRWPSVHLGALNSLYSRTPYFEHLHDSLTVAYADVEGRPLSGLCDCLHNIQIALLLPDGLLHSFAELSPEGLDRLRAVCFDYAGLYRPGVPFIDLLMHCGPDAIFVLLSSFYLK